MSGLAGKRVAIANRGEIAVRIAATCRRLGAIPVVLLGEPDLEGFAARRIGRVEVVGPAGAELDVERVVRAAQRTGAELLHPGYGFLSERPELAEACAAAGIRFVGPSPETLRLCGDKLATREAARRAGAPVLPASPLLGADPDEWLTAARTIGFPLMVKPAGAGGGRGLRRVEDESGLVAAVEASRREGETSGGGTVVYLERELVEPRHVEVQVVGDGRRALALGDRDCSLQRRHQKVIEEAPAPNLSERMRRELHDHARRIAEEVRLRGIATCEFLLGNDGTIAFLEVNPRIQVEHPVTEMVLGLDLVEWQLRLAAGEDLPVACAPDPRGHAIEARVYAENPEAGLIPVSGRLEAVAWPDRPDIRVDAGYGRGDVVPATYDAMLAKIIAHGDSREAALAALREALLDTIIAGIPTNLPWLLALIDDPAFRAGTATTLTARTVTPKTPDLRVGLLAAVAHTLDASKRQTSDPWAAIGPFRLSGLSTLTFHSEDWEEQVGVARGAAGWELAGGGQAIPLRWWRSADDVWTVSAGEMVARVAVIEHEQSVEVAGHGGRWLIRRGPRPASLARRQHRAADGRVRAPLPAKVLRVHVAPGDRVKAGQPVVTLTAMKMELHCEAPADGVVEAIHCAVDEQVEADRVLVSVQLEASA